MAQRNVYRQNTNTAKPMNGKKKSSNKAVRILWRTFWIGLVTFNLLIIFINFGLLGYMPSMKELENPSSALSSEVYAGDQTTLLGRYFIQDRSNCKFKDISPFIFNALQATEDARFYEHSGIDGIAVLRMIVFLGKEGGGSTITQQLAKNLFGRKNVSIFTLPFIKLKEWVLAVKLERNLTKDEIITLYLNTVPFSDNVYGIKNASLTFFNKKPDSVSVDEAAVLIGMLKGNTLYNPRRNPERAMRRRNVVMNQMVKYGFLTREEMESLMDKPIKLDYHKLDYHEGMAPYFRQEVEKDVKEILKEVINPETGDPYDLYRDGLRIYTTIDVRMQKYAEQSMEQHLKDIQTAFIGQADYKDGKIWDKEPAKTELAKAIKQLDRYKEMKDNDSSEEAILRELKRPVKMKVFAWNREYEKDTTMSPIDSMKYMKMFLQSGFMAVDPFTGFVKAWVGGINHTYFQYDHVNIDTKRQVGSTIKPLLYTLAIDNGLSPCNTIPTTPVMFPSFMNKPYDAGGIDEGTSLPMNVALAKSINNAALYLVSQVGINAFVDFAHRCGIQANLEKFPSVALGVSDISLYEMLWAYSMFPTFGLNTKPIFISKIEDKNGNLLKNFVPQQKEIINSSTAFKMIKMMKGVVDFGTGARLRYRYGITSEVAGKTGTTNNQADAWFIGYTPQLMAGAWVGCDDRYLRFKSEYLGQGAAAALPIWAIFMKKVYADKTLGIEEAAKFIPPDNFQDCEFYDPTSAQRAETIPYGSQGNDSLHQSDQEPVPVVPTTEWK